MGRRRFYFASVIAALTWHLLQPADGLRRDNATTLAEPARAELPQRPNSKETWASFAEWAERYTNTVSPPAQRALEEQGIALARTRHDDLAELIRTDPDQALKEALA